MFATTIEYVLTTYSKEYAGSPTDVLSDGSMHAYTKGLHLVNTADVEKFLQNCTDSKEITTPIYPFDNCELPDILKLFKSHIDFPNSAVLMHANNIRDCELNLLFQYHKIANGIQHQYGFDFFFAHNQHNIVNWDNRYTSWKDMKPWQLREWYSLFYPGTLHKWIDSQHQVPSNFLKLTNLDVLNNTEVCFQKIIQHCGLHESHGLSNFAKGWRQKQQYVIDEFELLDQIIECTLKNQDLDWANLNIFAESIVQCRLRRLGYEIQCDGLDIFPTNSKTLANLLERV